MFGKQRECILQVLVVAYAARSIPVHPCGRYPADARSHRFLAQPCIKTRGGRQCGRRIKVAQQPVGFVQMPHHDPHGALNACLVDDPCSSVIQQMEESRQPRDVLCGLGGHVPDGCVAAAAGEFPLDGVIGLYPGGVGRA